MWPEVKSINLLFWENRKMKCKRHILLPILIVCLLAPMVLADVVGGLKRDIFDVVLDGDNNFVGGGGSGWGGG